MAWSWVSEPTGRPRPFLNSSTPAMKVLETAPMPGSRMPNMPFGPGIRLAGLLILSSQIKRHDQEQQGTHGGGPEELIGPVDVGEKHEKVDEVAGGQGVLEP